MTSLVDVWVRSGKSSECLHPGSTEEIITELKSWVKRRKILNNIKVAECWDVFCTADYHQQIKAQLESTEEIPTQEVVDQIANLTAREMKSFIHLRVSHCTDHSEF